MFWASALVWFVTAPRIAEAYHLMTPVAIPLNLLIWLPLALSLFAGIAMLVCEPFAPPLAFMFGAICEFQLELLRSTVVRASKLPAAYHWCVGPGVVAGALFLVCLVLAACNRPWRHFWCAVAAIAFACGEYRYVAQRLVDTSQQVRCSVLALGHGCCVVAELPNGETWMYDAGRLRNHDRGVDIVSRFLWQRGITRLDRVFLSHADLDHFSLVPELCRRFQTHTIHYAAATPPQSSAGWLALIRAAKSRGVRLEPVASGDIIKSTEGVTAYVLHPSADARGSDNARSLVLALRAYGRELLLPGDLEGEGLQAVLEQPPRNSDAVLAPHHGSIGSRPYDFLAWCSAPVVAISGGNVSAREQYLHSVRGLGRPCVLHTAVHGCVTIAFGADGGFRLRTFRGPMGHCGNAGIDGQHVSDQLSLNTGRANKRAGQRVNFGGDRFFPVGRIDTHHHPSGGFLGATRCGRAAILVVNR